MAGFEKLDRKVLKIVHHEYVLPMKYLWFPLAAKSWFWVSGWFFVWPSTSKISEFTSEVPIRTAKINFKGTLYPGILTEVRM